MKKFMITLFLWFPTMLLSQDNSLDCEVVKMPSVFTPNNDFKNDLFIEIVISIHEFIVNLLYWFIGIHILAATYHRLKKDGVWSSMVPFFKEYKQ